MENDSHEAQQVIVVEPAQGRETQLLYWFRVCVAEWHNGVHPLTGTTHEEILVWDKGRSRYVLESHWYGKNTCHERERTALDEQRLREWILARSRQIVWRDDALEFYPAFIRPTRRMAANEPVLPLGRLAE